MRKTSVAIGVLLLVVGASASALTLGRAKGATLIGQPLELMVPVTVDAGQTDAALCADADVFHGDTRIEAGRVQVSVEPTSQADTFNIRVFSATLIDEPVVTVYVRAGCTQKSARRFVLLADFPGESTSNTPRAATAAVSAQPPLVTPIDSTPAKSGWSAANEALAVPKPRIKPVPVAKKEETPKAEKPEVKAAPKDQAKSASGGKARLKLDPLENLTERIKSLESSTVTAPNEEAGRDDQRLQQLQGDIKALLEQAAKNESNLVAMRERLEKAESERVPMFMVYVLTALLAACMAGLAWLWMRRPQRLDWADNANLGTAPAHQTGPLTEQQDDVPSQFAMNSTAPVQPANRPDAVVTPAIPTAPITPVLADVDVNLMDDMDDSAFTKLMEVNESPAKRPTAPITTHHFQSDEIQDIRQRATFFAKLGKLDEAIGILESGIRNMPDSNAFLYLDLLELANVHSLKTDFRQFRDEFQERFNVQVPEFAMFKDKGVGIDAYPDIQKYLASIWDTPDVFAAVESLIFRGSEPKHGVEFGINAFSELLDLHIAAYKRHAAQSVSG